LGDGGLVAGVVFFVLCHIVLPSLFWGTGLWCRGRVNGGPDLFELTGVGCAGARVGMAWRATLGYAIVFYGPKGTLVVALKTGRRREVER
jgi:hypothetical protein